MKQTLLALLISCTLAATAQDDAFQRAGVPVVDGQIKYQVIDSLPGATQAQIFTAMKAAVSDMFRNAKAVIQMDEKDAGKLLLKGNAFYVFKAPFKVDATAHFSVDMQAKDGKYRLQVYDIETGHTYVSEKYRGSGQQMRWRDAAITSFDARMDELIAGFQVAIKSKINSDNW